VPLNAVPLEDLKLLLGTFAGVMPGSGFYNFENCVLLLGFAEPDWAVSPRRLENVFAHDELSRDLENAGCAEAADLIAAYICDGEKMNDVARLHRVMKDDHTTVEYVRIAPGVESFKRMADGFGFLHRALQSPDEHIDWSGTEKSESLANEIESARLSFRYVLKGLQAENASFYKHYYPEAELAVDDPERLFEKAFLLNPRDRRSARKYTRSLLKRAEGLMHLGQFKEARELVDRAAVSGRDLFEFYIAEALLRMASGDLDAFKDALDGMAAVLPYSNMETALRARLARLEGEGEKADRFEKSLERGGGLSAAKKDLLDRVFETAMQNRSSRGPPNVERLVDLLKAGPGTITEKGKPCWDKAAEAAPELLARAREELEKKLSSGGDEAGRAAMGLAFFKGEETIELLRDAYIDSGPDDRPAILHALFLAGDSMTYLDVLQSESARPALLLKAVEISAAAGSMKSIPYLIDLLEHRSERIRVGALVALIELTGRRFDYDPYGSEKARSEAIKRWRRWDEIRRGG